MDLTAKQENYARARAKGMPEGKTKSDAFRESRDTSRMKAKQVHEEACRLDSKPKVRQRIAELLENCMDANEVTPEVIIKGLLDEALNAESDGARVTAWKTLAQARSMLIAVNKDLSTELSDEQLVAGFPEHIRAAMLAHLRGEDVSLPG